MEGRILSSLAKLMGQVILNGYAFNSYFHSERNKSEPQIKFQSKLLSGTKAVPKAALKNVLEQRYCFLKNLSMCRVLPSLKSINPLNENSLMAYRFFQVDTPHTGGN